jgi:hypothetical protein
MAQENNMNIKKAVIFVSLVLTLLSCGRLDVVGTGSVESFDKLLKQSSRPVEAENNNNGWSLAAPDGSARFFWSRNYAESPQRDVSIEFDAAPFIAAGLDPQKLPGPYAVNNGRITVGTKLGTEVLRYPGGVTPYAYT